MALRCFGSPRFTVYDADFSTTAATVDPPDSITPLLRYSDENLDIIPLGAGPSDQRKSLITVEPIRFDAAFTAIALTEQEQQFKADVSFRGLLLDGRQVPFTTPYTLRLWQEAPAVWVMDPLETLAEKILGWCVHGTVKHYADIGWITLAAQQPGSPLVFTHFKLREVLDEKLRIMRSLQPALYEPYPSVEARSSASSRSHRSWTAGNGKNSSTCKDSAPPTRRLSWPASFSTSSRPASEAHSCAERAAMTAPLAALCRLLRPGCAPESSPPPPALASMSRSQRRAANARAWRNGGAGSARRVRDGIKASGIASIGEVSSSCGHPPPPCSRARARHRRAVKAVA